MSLSYGPLCSYANTVFRPTGEMLPKALDITVFPRAPITYRENSFPAPESGTTNTRFAPPLPHDRTVNQCKTDISL